MLEVELLAHAVAELGHELHRHVVVGLVVALLVAELDKGGAAAAHDLPADDGRQHGVVREPEVLDDQGQAAAERRLHRVHHRAARVASRYRRAPPLNIRGLSMPFSSEADLAIQSKGTLLMKMVGDFVI